MTVTSSRMARPTFIQIKSLTSLSIKIRIGKRENGKAIRKASTSQKLYNDVFLARQQNKRKEYHIEKYWPDVYYARIVSSAHVYRK